MIAVLLNALVLFAAPAAGAVDVAPVWAGHPVGFCLYTHGNQQFVAYYDAERCLTVAVRKLGETAWHTAKLSEHVVWDSHNYITLAIDDEGYLHLSGNMHVVPLIYFRTAKPLDIDPFERVKMTGEREDRCTYPKFLRGPKNELIFTYRDGSSGKGDQIFNVYDPTAKTWRRLLDTPLLSGENERNAYLEGPLKGPDGRFHLAWVWRDTGDCATNHDVSYARSADFVHWESASGNPLTLPITFESAETVDPIPPGGGVINGNVKLGFDSQHRVLVSYHKYDEAGNTQLWAVRLENGAWQKHQISHWDYRWGFSGGGAIPWEISVSAIRPDGPGKLKQAFRHIKYGAGAFVLDEATMQVLDTAQTPPQSPAVEAGKTGMEEQHAGDLGKSPSPDVRYELRWETLGYNRDKPRPGPIPEPSMLRVVELGR